MPRIRLDVANWLVLDPFRPASKPVDRFITVLLAAAHHAAAEHGPSSGEVLPLGAWRRALSSPEPAAALAEIAESIRRHLGRLDTGILIAIDQAEELFTLAGDAERDGFLKLLADALGNGLPYFAVATLRSEYLSDLQAARSLSVALEPYTLAPLPLERLSALVRGPARLAGLGVEDALVDALISDAGSTDALPLVAFTLRRLYEAERGSGRLTLARYRALGDEARGLNPLENAVRQTAEEALPRDGRSDEADDALKRAFIAGLVRATPDGKLVRRSAPVAMFAPAVREDIDHLVHARLLVLRTEDLDGVEQEVVEVAHESLFRVWDRLAKWIGEEGDFLVGKSRITQAREDWKALAPAKRELNKGLLGDILLERASAWLAERPKAFSAEERTGKGVRSSFFVPLFPSERRKKVDPNCARTAAVELGLVS